MTLLIKSVIGYIPGLFYLHKSDFSFGVAQSVSPKIFVTSSNIFFLNTPFAHPSEDKSHKQGPLRNEKNKTLYPSLWLTLCVHSEELFRVLSGLVLAKRGWAKVWSETVSRHYGAMSSRKHRLVGAGSTKN